jgi:glycerol uptake facilitator-like aquaporin
MHIIHFFKKWILCQEPHVLSKACIEMIGCTMFHFIGSLAPTPFANGVALMCIVYYVAHVTGAHLNPALTLTFSLLGYYNPFEMFIYWAAQISGCVIGALLLAALVPGLHAGQSVPRIGGEMRYDGCFEPHGALSKGEIFGWEAIGTFMFLVPIFSVVWYTHRKQGYGTTGPIMVGLSLMASAFAVGPFTGASLNPARTLGSLIVFKCPQATRESYGYYILGEMVGAYIVPLAIIPWYGIAHNAWYLHFVPSWMIKQMQFYQPSIKIPTSIPHHTESNLNEIVSKDTTCELTHK